MQSNFKQEMRSNIEDQEEKAKFVQAEREKLEK